MNNPQELTILEDFVNILEQLGIEYAIGGSMASSIYGRVRFTEDADITVGPFDEQAGKLVEVLKTKYYVSTEAMQEALKRRTSFNIIHLESAFKIDIFVRKDTAFEKQLIVRCRFLKLSDSLEKSFSVVSPEDIILLKLQWYQAGGSSSERQWNDILGVLLIQTGSLDLGYLKKWSAVLGVRELLENAVSESKL